MIVIFDLDGTLADDRHRHHFLERDPPEWGEYFAACADDPPIRPMVKLARALHLKATWLVIWTGRPERHREATRAWLSAKGVSYAELRMRDDQDYRPANEIKAEWLRHMRGLMGAPDLAFDDRVSAVQWWREQGITCLDVAGNTY